MVRSCHSTFYESLGSSSDLSLSLSLKVSYVWGKVQLKAESPVWVVLFLGNLCSMRFLDFQHAHCKKF
jgi:hypothetical protein